MIGLAVVIFLAFGAETVTGYGSVMIALSLGALWWPLESLLPVVVPTSLLLSGYIVARHGRAAHWRLLLGQVLPVMAVGLLLGQITSGFVSGVELKAILGLVVAVAAIRGLRSMRRPSSGRVAGARRPWMLLAGVVHGMVATGGPPLVYALEGAGLEKRIFRSTLAVVWFTLNAALTVRFAIGGSLGTAELIQLLYLVPVVALAIGVGEHLHGRVSETLFRVVVLFLLVAAGCILCGPALAEHL